MVVKNVPKCKELKEINLFWASNTKSTPDGLYSSCIECTKKSREALTCSRLAFCHHIIPQSLLPFSDFSDENFKKLWALSNLQPLETVANIKKRNKVIY